MRTGAAWRSVNPLYRGIYRLLVFYFKITSNTSLYSGFTRESRSLYIINKIKSKHTNTARLQDINKLILYELD